MKKPTINFIVDCVGFIALLFLATTGYINRYILPPAPAEEAGEVFQKKRFCLSEGTIGETSISIWR